MALSFAQLALIAGESEFQTRVLYALTVAAINVSSESTSTAGHPARAAYAQNILTGSAGNLASACYAVLANATIATEATAAQPGNNIPDGDIQFTVNSLWNALAGA